MAVGVKQLSCYVIVKMAEPRLVPTEEPSNVSVHTGKFGGDG